MKPEELNNWVRAQGYRPMHHFRITRVDRRRDKNACVVEAKDGSCRLVWTNNGVPYFAESKEAQKRGARPRGFDEDTMTALALLGLAEDK